MAAKAASAIKTRTRRGFFIGGFFFEFGFERNDADQANGRGGGKGGGVFRRSPFSPEEFSRLLTLGRISGGWFSGSTARQQSAQRSKQGAFVPGDSRSQGAGAWPPQACSARQELAAVVGQPTADCSGARTAQNAARRRRSEARNFILWQVEPGGENLIPDPREVRSIRRGLPQAPRGAAGI